MRPHQIFAGMPADGAEAFFTRIAEQSPALFAQLVQAAAAAFKSRPQFLMKQPFERRAANVRPARARGGADALAGGTRAGYVLEGRKDIVTAWLDRVGLPHEEGVLKQERPAEPIVEDLDARVREFRDEHRDPDCDLLLRAFAAQASIDWPHLDTLLATAR